MVMCSYDVKYLCRCYIILKIYKILIQIDLCNMLKLPLSFVGFAPVFTSCYIVMVTFIKLTV